MQDRDMQGRDLRILVIGGGTAGWIAATHVSRHLPEATLHHVYDPRRAPIGVGEGTAPRFPMWLKATAGVEFDELRQRCQATLKKGTEFVGWGPAGRTFLNRFQPVDYVGYHFDTADLAAVLAERVRSEIVAKRVDAVTTVHAVQGAQGPAGAEVRFEDASVEHYDYVFDGRGFPAFEPGSPEAAGKIDLTWIPTRAALVRRTVLRDESLTTRAIARPHGWIFYIPLAEVVSFGYMHHPECSDEAEVVADFDAFCQEQGFDEVEDRGRIRYPSFIHRTLFDGAVFRVGNAASFIEPLEATSLGTTVRQVREAVRLIQSPDEERKHPSAIAVYNRKLGSFILKNSLFIGWHYACGSPYDTEFWRRAKERFEAARQAVPGPMVETFDAYAEAARSMPGLELPLIEDAEQWRAEVFPLLTSLKPFGNFSQLNFAQIGHGLGFYEQPPSSGAAFPPSASRSSHVSAGE